MGGEFTDRVVKSNKKGVSCRIELGHLVIDLLESHENFWLKIIPVETLMNIKRGENSRRRLPDPD